MTGQNICLRKTEVSVEIILVYKVIENLVEHGRYCLPCSTKFSMTLYCLTCFYTNSVIDLLPCYVTMATTELSMFN